MPKEMLPVVDKPAIQYVVEEAVAAGLRDVLMITGANKQALENHFDRVPTLERTLIEKGDTGRLEQVMRSAELADVHYLRQGEPLGLGHAVLRAKQHVAEQPFAVLLGDDIIAQDETLLADMIDTHETRGASVIALLEVAPEVAHRFGIATVEPIEQTGDSPIELVRVLDLVEKPAPGTQPSNLAVIGRYVLQPEVFDILERTEAGAGGEIQLTDALREMAVEGIAGGVYGVVFRGRRFDTGDRLDYIKAIIELATEREDLGPELRPWLKEFVSRL